MSSLFLDSSATVPTFLELPAGQRAAMAALGARLSADPVLEPEAFGRQARLLARPDLAVRRMGHLLAVNGIGT